MREIIEIPRPPPLKLSERQPRVGINSAAAPSFDEFKVAPVKSITYELVVSVYSSSVNSGNRCASNYY